MESEKDFSNIKEWNVKRIGDIFIFGIKGSGKTCKLLTLSQAMYDRGIVKKLWDIYGGERHEGGFITFPNRDYKLWNDLEKETFELSEAGPKQYRVTLLCPLFSKEIPDKIPEDMPNVKTKIFTIPIRAITKQYIGLVVGEVGREAETLWEKIKDECADNSNGEDVKYLMDTRFYKMKKTHFYTTFIKPLVENHFLSSENSKTNLNILEEAEDTERITILYLEYVPEQFHFFIMGYILKELFTLAKKDKTHKKHFAIMREASRFMKVVDEDKNKSAQANAFRNLLVDIVRYGRSGLFFGLDTQDSSEVRGLIDGQQEILGICELPSQNSIETTCLPLKQAKRMSQFQINYIQWKIQKHQICIVERGEKAVILKRINPPRTMYWKPEYGNFISFWKKEKDKWKEDLKDIIENAKKEHSDRISILKIKNLKFEEEEVVEIKEKEELPLEEVIEIKNEEENETKSRVPKARF